MDGQPMVWAVLYFPGMHFDVDVVGVFTSSEGADACAVEWRAKAREAFLARSDAEKEQPVGWAKVRAVHLSGPTQDGGQPVKASSARKLPEEPPTRS